jgi:NAD(P)-dependent dehydrogenase (short-subunit alcohol dehydrogenase family)
VGQRAIIITGASTGIGLEAARTFKSRGWFVICSARKPDDIERMGREVGVTCFPADLGDPASIDRFVASALAASNNRIDALYNNAAHGVIGAMEDLTPDILRQQLEVNVVGTHHLTRAIVPVMRRQGAGRIVFCSSVLGLVTGRFRGAYSASKYAIEAIADAYRYELDGSGIAVSILEPGPIRTAFLNSTAKHFADTVDVQSSPHRAAYEDRLASLTAETSSRFKLGPEAVVKSLVHAVESARPKVRYRISPHTYAMAFAKRALPSSLLDSILKRA